MVCALENKESVCILGEKAEGTPIIFVSHSFHWSEELSLESRKVTSPHAESPLQRTKSQSSSAGGRE